MYGVEVSPTMISNVTNKLVPVIKEWKSRLLQSVYAVVFLDAIHFKVKQDWHIVNKAAYLDGNKDVLGMWIGENESSKFWLGVLNDLKNRGVQDILITCVDNLIRQANPAPKHLIIMEHDVWNPFTNVVDPNTLWIFQHPSCKAVLYTNPSMLYWGERSVGPDSSVKVIAAGFPYDHEKINAIMDETKPTKDREKLVVFPGRLNEFYQPYLSVRMAMELKDSGYRTVITSPVEPQSHYPVSLWQQLGIEVGKLPQPEYYRLLSKAKAAISVTIGGSLTLALYEAYLLGAKPIIPMDINGRPPFTEIYEPRYDILNPREALRMIDDNTEIHIDKKWFDYRRNVEILLDTIDSCCK